MSAFDITRGTTKIFEMQLQTPSGGAYSPPEQANIGLYIAHQVNNTPIAAAVITRQLSLVESEPGVVTYEFMPIDTVIVPANSYWAEVRVEKNGKVWKTPPFRFIVNNPVVNV